MEAAHRSRRRTDRHGGRIEAKRSLLLYSYTAFTSTPPIITTHNNHHFNDTGRQHMPSHAIVASVDPVSAISRRERLLELRRFALQHGRMRHVLCVTQPDPTRRRRRWSPPSRCRSSLRLDASRHIPAAYAGRTPALHASLAPHASLALHARPVCLPCKRCLPCMCCLPCMRCLPCLPCMRRLPCKRCPPLHALLALHALPARRLRASQPVRVFDLFALFDLFDLLAWQRLLIPANTC